jgi:predicted acetyltransferase
MLTKHLWALLSMLEAPRLLGRGSIMREIRRLAGDEFLAFARISANAYPGFPIRTEEEVQRMAERSREQDQNQAVAFYGLFEAGTLLGGMELYDFTMNVHGAQTPAAGVGGVAVDLLHKKEHAARDLIRFFLDAARQKGAALALLYPFRPDFYKQMGFGYGTKMNEYRVRPASLPKGPSKQHIAWLSPDDKPLLLGCYQRCQAQTHGLIQRSEADFARFFASLDRRVVGYRRDGQVQGYLVFGFQQHAQGNFLINDLRVDEFVYETREALAELLTFLRSQADQVRFVIIRTQDEEFHHLLLDPRNDSEALLPSIYHPSNVQGVGLMYRVIDLPGVFARLREHDFGGQTCRLRLAISDSFYPANAGSVVVSFQDGRPSISPEDASDVEIRLDVAEFSSLLLGVVSFRSLYLYGLAEISDPAYLETINRLFLVPNKPICLTAF